MDGGCHQPTRVSVELRVLFDGPDFGLPDHRLSLSTFATPLSNLLSAVQRTASQILTAAQDNPEYGVRGGKLAADAKLLDLELAQVHEGCAEPRFVITTGPGRSGQLTMLEDLAASTVEQLVRDIETEARGVPRNAAARRFLKSLPTGLTRQRYTASAHGKVLYTADFGSAALPEPGPLLGQLLRKRAKLIGVGFEPTTVRLRFDARQLTLHASTEQIDRALEHRYSDVLAAFVDDGDKSRLIWIRSVVESAAPVPLKATVDHLRESWTETLRILGS